MSAADEPSDSTRFPGLTAHGRHMLDHLREHPNAPIYRNQSGHRLLPEDLERVIYRCITVPSYGLNELKTDLEAFIAKA